MQLALSHANDGEQPAIDLATKGVAIVDAHPEGLERDKLVNRIGLAKVLMMVGRHEQGARLFRKLIAQAPTLERGLNNDIRVVQGVSVWAEPNLPLRPFEPRLMAIASVVLRANGF